MVPWGTLINVAAIIVGSSAGLLLRQGLPERVRGIIFQAIGLCTLVIGMLNAFEVARPVPDETAIPKHLIVVIFSIIIGSMIGELCRIEDRLNALGDSLKKRIKGSGSRFTEGLVTAFLIFCIGPMTMVGALNEGIRGDATLLHAKAVLDCFMSIALTSTFGIGVLFSIVPLFIFQYATTLFGALMGDVLSPVMINQLTAVGGILILGLGVTILDLKKLRVANMLPALVIVVLLTWIFG